MDKTSMADLLKQLKKTDPGSQEAKEILEQLEKSKVVSRYEFEEFVREMEEILDDKETIKEMQFNTILKALYEINEKLDQLLDKKKKVKNG